MLSTEINVIALFTLALCAFSGCNAAPLNGAQGNSPLTQLVPRGILDYLTRPAATVTRYLRQSPPSAAIGSVTAPRPTLEDAMKRSAITEEKLKDKALFYFRFQQAEMYKIKEIAEKKGKYRFMDLYPADVKDKFEKNCGSNEGIELLSEAMGTLASGEVWVVSRYDPLLTGNLSQSRMWRAELEAMRGNTKVEQLHVLNPDTNKVTVVPVHALETYPL